MAIKNIIAKGLGFTSDGTRWLPTHGFGPESSLPPVVLRTFTPEPRSFTAPTFDTVREAAPGPRSFTAPPFDTVREFTPIPRSFTCPTIQLPREPMTTLPNIAPGETRLFKWPFQLAGGETISTATLTALANCTLAGSTTISGGNVTRLVQIADNNALIGSVAQVHCRIDTSAGRRLDKTLQSTIGKHYTEAGEIDPDDIDDLTLLGAPLLAEHAATISAFACAVDEGAITVGSTSFTTNTATARLSAAGAGARHRLRYQLTLSNSEVVREYPYVDGLTL